MPKTFIDISGQRFGNLIAIKKVPKPENALTTGTYWLCECDCGNKEFIAHTGLLRRGNTKHCNLCSKKGSKKGNHIPLEKIKTPTNPEAGFNYLYTTTKGGAKSRNLSFEITKDDLRYLSKQNCFYCGREPSTVTKCANGIKSQYVYNGLDRVDSSKGYALDNIVTCCGICNKMKMVLGKQEFLDQVEKIYKYQMLKNT